MAGTPIQVIFPQEKQIPCNADIGNNPDYNINPAVSWDVITQSA